MLNRSASLAMSTSVLKALPGKLDIKRHSSCILYLSTKTVLKNQVNGIVITDDSFHYNANILLISLLDRFRTLFSRDYTHLSFLNYICCKNVLSIFIQLFSICIIQGWDKNSAIPVVDRGHLGYRDLFSYFKPF